MGSPGEDPRVAGRGWTSCTSCGRENPPDNAFCGGCGAKLERSGGAAESKRGDSPATSYTPRHLAEQVFSSTTTLEGERKQVTVLFVDVCSSVALAERVGAEAWHQILDGFFRILTEGIHRFGGTINQYTGDGVMALFGAPTAYEDHACRACYSALYLTDELRDFSRAVKGDHGIDFSLRMGLSSGEVVVGRIGDDLRMDYTAQGLTVGVGARMAQLALPGAIYLDETTATLTSGYTQLQDLGPFEVRGVGQPLRVYELEGVGASPGRFELTRAQELTRFVGRVSELAAFEEALSEALDGRGTVMGIVGEAGVGKSRLCFEFVERCRSRGVLVLQGSAPAYGADVVFQPILQMLRALCELKDSDGDEAARQKIAGRLLLLDGDLQHDLGLLFEFFGYPDPERPGPRSGPAARQSRLLTVLRRIVQRAAVDRPVVTVIEDAHWSDPGSSAVLEQWASVIADSRGLLLVNFRPGIRAPWMDVPNYRELRVEPLGPDASRTLLQDLLGLNPDLDALRNAIVDRAAGNPFYLEQIVSSLADSGHLSGSRGVYKLEQPVERLPLPASVQALLAARIDRLAGPEKQVLHAAAVSGDRVSERVLERVVDLSEDGLAAALRTLTRAGFLFEVALYPELAYGFAHPLTREVAYGSQLRDQRARIHAAVAQALEQIDEQADEQAAAIAAHYEQGLLPLRAAEWYRRAAEKAGSADAVGALTQWRRAWTLASESRKPECEPLLLQAAISILYLGASVGLDEDEAERVFEAGKDLALRSGELSALAMLLDGYGGLRATGGDLEGALSHDLAASQLAGQLPDPVLRITLAANSAARRASAGRLRENLPWVERALALPTPSPKDFEATGSGDSFTQLLLLRAFMQTWVGRLDAARSGLDDTVRIAGERGALEIVAWGNALYPELYELIGTGEGHAQARRAVEVAERTGSLVGQSAAHWGVGVAECAAKRFDRAIDALTTSLRLARESRTYLQFESQLLARLAGAQLGAGDRNGALASAREAVEIARRQGARLQEARARLALGHAFLANADRVAEASGELDASERLFEECGARAFLPFLLEARASVAERRSDPPSHRAALASAANLFHEMGASAHARRIQDAVAAGGSA